MANSTESEAIYHRLIPRSVFGRLSEEEMDKKLTLRLGPGNIKGLFRVLDNGSRRMISGEEEQNPILRDSILLASTKTITEVLSAAQASKLPVDAGTLSTYQGFTNAFILKDPSQRAANLLLERRSSETEPYTRTIRKREGNIITEYPIYVDQLNLISIVMLRAFKDALGVNWDEGSIPYMQSVGFLHRVLVDLRTDHLNLPVRENFINLVEAAYNLAGISERRI